jgi:alkylation response protein AidB-like acyl-CoA dehydrogenase
MIADRPVLSYRKGGSFLLEAVPATDVQIPEDFAPEIAEFSQALSDFVKARVLPNVARLEEHDNPLLRQLLQECGAQGFFQIEVPEAYGGLDLSKTTATRVSEGLSQAGGFSVAFGAHSSIGMLPLVYFGSDMLKAKYLEQLASAQMIGAYCLSEPGSGSDAQAAKTKAVASDDGSSYTLNGTKMWISNGGIADIYTVFCQVQTDEGQKFSAFLVERNYPGVSLGKEEEKMGIRMSSTTQLILEDVVVPAENLLGEVGWGAKIAFNILNIGRYKLGAGGIGGSKAVLAHASKYSQERMAFGGPISRFGLMQEKLGEMATRIFAAESATYRVTGLIDHLAKPAKTNAEKLKAIEEYAAEASILKVFGSEVLDYCTDEAVQIYGGYGYSEEYPVARAYRDARINRIFEGTNEINRLLIPGTFLKRAMKGELPLLAAAQKLQGELLEPSFEEDDNDAPLAQELRVIAKLKKLALMIAGQAAMKFGPKLDHQQELLSRVADIIIQTFTAESAVLRSQKLMQAGKTNATMLAMSQMLVHDAAEKSALWAREALSSFMDGDDLRLNLSAVRRFSKHESLNTVALRRQVAAAVLESEGYPIR